MTAADTPESQVRAFYGVLMERWGPQHWWPARTRFEVIVGAYLTQNTAWTNVEKAISNLRRARVLSRDGIRRLSLERLEQLVRPAGYFRQKARRLKTFLSFLDRHYGGSLDRMFAQPTGKLREQLLALNGVGPETADSILLYAGNHPVFVVDAYTRRILARHAPVASRQSPVANRKSPVTAPARSPRKDNVREYEEVRELFESALREHSAADDEVSFRQVAGANPSSMCSTRRRQIQALQVVGSQDDGMRGRNHPRHPALREPAAGGTPLTQFAAQDKTTAGGRELRGAAHLPSPMSTARREALVQIYNEMHAFMVGLGKHYCLKAQAKCAGCPLERFLRTE
jgi:endonuclease-3 related protein